MDSIEFSQLGTESQFTFLTLAVSPQKVSSCYSTSSFQHSAFWTHEATPSHQLSLQSSLGIIAVKCCLSFSNSTIKICRRDLDARLQLPASCCTSSRLSVRYLSSRSLCFVLFNLVSTATFQDSFSIKVIFKSLSTECKNSWTWTSFGRRRLTSHFSSPDSWVVLFLTSQRANLFHFLKKRSQHFCSWEYCTVIMWCVFFLPIQKTFFASFQSGFKWKSPTCGHTVRERCVENLPSDSSDRAHARRSSFPFRKFQHKQETLTHRRDSLLRRRRVQMKQTKLELEKQGFCLNCLQQTQTDDLLSVWIGRVGGREGGSRAVWSS